MFSRVVIHPLVVTVCLASHAAAQAPPDGQLRGTVWDATRAVVAGATVVVSAPQLIGGPRTYTSGADGQWRAAALPPGDYTASVSAPGFTTVTTDRLRLLPGATLTLDTELGVAAQVEQARAEAARPAIDVTTAAVTYTVGEPMLRGLPTSRTFSDLLNLFPGVAGDQALGGSKLSNGLVVDGVDTTEASEQNPWLRFSQNWLQEVQGVGLGADAQYGVSTGLTAFGTTRSGTNRYSGLAEGWSNPSSWVAVNTRALSAALQRQFTSARVETYWNANAQLGGPVRIDRLWFFAGLDHTTSDGAPAGYNGADMQRERDTRGIAKVTWKAWPAGLVEGFLQGGRRQVRNFGLSSTVPSEAAAEYRQPQVSGNLRVLHAAGDALFEAVYSGARSPGITAPQAPGALDGPPGHVDQVTGAYSVNLLFHSRDDMWRNTVSASATWFGRLGRQTHELKVGVLGERAHAQTTSGYSGGLAYLDNNGSPSLVQYFEGFGTQSLRGDTARLTAYLQDRVSLGSRLTLSPGMRIDRFAWSTAAAGEVLSTRPLSPRLGLAWDVRRDHRTVVRAHVGRYTDPAFSQPVLLADTAQRPLQILAQVVAPRVFEEIRRTDFRTRLLDDDIRHSYVDQFVGGVEQQLFAGLTVLGQYIHREFRSFLAYAPDNVAWTPVARQDPGPDGRLGTQDDGAVFTVYSQVLTGTSGTVFQRYGNLENGWRQYRGGQVVLRTTATGPVQLQASYTRSQTRGTVTTGLHANAGVRVFNAANPNRLINGDELTPFDPANEVKVLALWSPRRYGGWVASGVYRYLTGGAWGRVFMATGLPQGNEAIRVEPRGTRRLPAINQLDLHLEKAVSVRGRVLSSFVDVFNVSNQGVPDSESGDVVIANSGPNLGVPTRWRLPRQGRIGLRLTF
ncbi:MAG: carboxypeptidase regulatory-like domain-containing protein [Vicinamibacterales bacterium]